MTKLHAVCTAEYLPTHLKHQDLTNVYIGGIRFFRTGLQHLKFSFNMFMLSVAW